MTALIKQKQSRYQGTPWDRQEEEAIQKAQADMAAFEQYVASLADAQSRNQEDSYFDTQALPSISTPYFSTVSNQRNYSIGYYGPNVQGGTRPSTPAGYQRALLTQPVPRASTPTGYPGSPQRGYSSPVISQVGSFGAFAPVSPPVIDAGNGQQMYDFSALGGYYPSTSISSAPAYSYVNLQATIPAYLRV
jgi:hypothetical protein